MEKRKKEPEPEEPEPKHSRGKRLLPIGAESSSNRLDGGDGSRLSTRAVSLHAQDAFFPPAESRRKGCVRVSENCSND